MDRRAVRFRDSGAGASQANKLVSMRIHHFNSYVCSIRRSLFVACVGDFGSISMLFNYDSFQFASRSNQLTSLYAGIRLFPYQDNPSLLPGHLLLSTPPLPLSRQLCNSSPRLHCFTSSSSSPRLNIHKSHSSPPPTPQNGIHLRK